MTSLAVATVAEAQFQIPFVGGPAPERKQIRPNDVFVLTDDQDLHMDSLSFTPLIKKHLIDQRASYRKHFCTTAVCCPSWGKSGGGELAHNTNVTDLNPTYGVIL